MKEIKKMGVLVLILAFLALQTAAHAGKWGIKLDYSTAQLTQSYGGLSASAPIGNRLGLGVHYFLSRNEGLRIGGQYFTDGSYANAIGSTTKVSLFTVDLDYVFMLGKSFYLELGLGSNYSFLSSPVSSTAGSGIGFNAGLGYVLENNMFFEFQYRNDLSAFNGGLVNSLNGLNMGMGWYF